jgi:hypothetical protein
VRYQRKQAVRVVSNEMLLNIKIKKGVGDPKGMRLRLFVHLPRPGQKKKKKNLSACRGEVSVVGPLLAARVLPLRCAASTMPIYTLLAIC